MADDFDSFEFQQRSGRIIITQEKPGEPPEVYTLLRPTFGRLMRLLEAEEQLDKELAETAEQARPEDVGAEPAQTGNIAVLLQTIGRAWLTGPEGAHLQMRWWQEVFRQCEADCKVPEDDDIPLPCIDAGVTLRFKVLNHWIHHPTLAPGTFDLGAVLAAANGANS